MFRLTHSAVGKIFAIAAVALTLLALPSRTTLADTVSVIPPRFELRGNPGDTIQEKLRIRNDSQQSITYAIQVEDFQAKDDQGGVDIIEDDSGNDSYKLASWITTDLTRVTVAAGEEKTLTATIKIPKSAEPGGHFATILIKRSGGEVSGGASVDSRIGSLILLRVSGAITESAAVDSFKAEESIAQYGPVTFSLRTKNDGNVHVQPKGTIVIYNIFGREVTKIPLTQANVLPGSARIVKTLWDEKNLVGRYTATLQATYEQNSQPGVEPKTLTASTTFVVFPLWLLWTILGIIIILFLMVTQRKGIKRALNRLTAD
ncbi:hypothetical protein BH11PAT4_BH11PAT4_1270 [soil metagenome]